MNTVNIEVLPAESIKGLMPDKYLTSRYGQLYRQIDKALEKDGWIRIADFIDFKTAINVYQAIRKHYRKETIRFYKYNERGEIEPQIFIRKHDIARQEKTFATPYKD